MPVTPSSSVRDAHDLAVEQRLKFIKQEIERWAIKKDVWQDCAIADYQDYSSSEPLDLPVLMVLQFDGHLLEALNGYCDEELQQQFSDLLANHQCWYELETGSSALIFPDEGTDYSAYSAYFHWRWICSLVKQDISDVYEELYSHFASRPEDLYNLHWRDYEILLARIFQTQGFEVELGPGQNDGGVDIKLIQRDPIGDILTVVQAKKYAKHRRIDRTEVAALYGIQKADNAHASLFVTTSTYAPAAKKFAGKVSEELTLADSASVVSWCRSASDGIIRDKSSLISRQHVVSLMQSIGERRDPRIIHGSWGYNSTHNSFALVLKESRHAALVMPIGRKILNHDGYGQRGTEVPSFDNSLPHLNADGVIRVRRTQDQYGANYQSDRRSYGVWDGKPCSFDYYD